jgi:hypothetical protein
MVEEVDIKCTEQPDINLPTKPSTKLSIITVEVPTFTTSIPRNVRLHNWPQTQDPAGLPPGLEPLRIHQSITNMPGNHELWRRMVCKKFTRPNTLHPTHAFIIDVGKA